MTSAPRLASVPPRYGAGTQLARQPSKAATQVWRTVGRSARQASRQASRPASLAHAARQSRTPSLAVCTQVFRSLPQALRQTESRAPVQIPRQTRRAALHSLSSVRRPESAPARHRSLLLEQVSVQPPRVSSQPLSHASKSRSQLF